MGTFREATTITGSDGHYEARLDPEWFIWGPFGGYMAAIAVRAMGACSLQPLPATFSCQYLSAGDIGSLALDVEVLRSGRSAQYLQAHVRQQGELLLEAQSWFIANEMDGIEHDVTAMPQVDPPSSLAPFLALPNSREEARQIWRHILRRPREQISEAATGDPRWECWLSLAESAPDDWISRAARIVLFMDMAPWNAVLKAHALPLEFIAPTLDLTVQFQPGLYKSPSGSCEWLLAAVESPVAAHGLVGSRGELWTESGTLVATGASQCLCRRLPQ